MSAITFKDGEKEYTLEYSVESISAIEKSGFDYTKLATCPATMLPLFIYGAFLKHHGGKITVQKATEIFKKLKPQNKAKDALVMMYADTLKELAGTADEAEDNEGNPNWVQA